VSYVTLRSHAEIRIKNNWDFERYNDMSLVGFTDVALTVSGFACPAALLLKIAQSREIR
jgi:hypothetical protein